MDRQRLALARFLFAGLPRECQCDSEEVPNYFGLSRQVTTSVLRVGVSRCKLDRLVLLPGFWVLTQQVAEREHLDQVLVPFVVEVEVMRPLAGGQPPRALANLTDQLGSYAITCSSLRRTRPAAAIRSHRTADPAQRAFDADRRAAGRG